MVLWSSIIADSFSLLAAFYILLMIFIAVLLTKDKERKIIYLSLISFLPQRCRLLFLKRRSSFRKQVLYFSCPLGKFTLSSTIFALFSRFGKFREYINDFGICTDCFYYVSGIHKKKKKNLWLRTY